MDFSIDTIWGRRTRKSGGGWQVLDWSEAPASVFLWGLMCARAWTLGQADMAEDLLQGNKLGFWDGGLGGGQEAACGVGLDWSQGSECSHTSEVAYYAATIPELRVQPLL